MKVTKDQRVHLPLCSHLMMEAIYADIATAGFLCNRFGLNLHIYSSPSPSFFLLQTIGEKNIWPLKEKYLYYNFFTAFRNDANITHGSAIGYHWLFCAHVKQFHTFSDSIIIRESILRSYIAKNYYSLFFIAHFLLYRIRLVFCNIC